MPRKKRYKRTQEGKTSRLVCDIMALINEVGETKLKDLFKVYKSEKYNFVYSKIPNKRQLLLLLKLAEWYNKKAGGYEKIKMSGRKYSSYLLIGNVNICDKRNKFYRIRKQYRDYIYVIEWARRVCMREQERVETMKLRENFIASLSVILDIPYYILRQLATNLLATKSNRRIRKMGFDELQLKVEATMGVERTKEVEKEISQLCSYRG